MRFGWKTFEKPWGEPLTITDLEIHILDKDNQTHIRTIKGKWSCWGLHTDVTPYVDDIRYRATVLLERSEYVQLDNKDVRIPRCNIKTVTYKEVNERQEQPMQEFRGIPRWHGGDWFCFMFMAGFGLLCLGALALIIFGKKG